MFDCQSLFDTQMSTKSRSEVRSSMLPRARYKNIQKVSAYLGNVSVNGCFPSWIATRLHVPIPSPKVSCNATNSSATLTSGRVKGGMLGDKMMP